MGKATGFLEYKRKKAPERDPKVRIKDWNEYQLPFSENELKIQAARCMDCGTPFCHTGMELRGMPSGCPLYNLIPEWNDLVYQNRWQEALERLLKTNNFPEFTGRVCPAPCEGSCTVALSDDPVAIKSIEKAIIDKGFQEGWIKPNPPKVRTGKKVAVVGSGPAGLAAADQLNKAGHTVTVFEKDDRVGGLLTYGIPSMKLEKSTVDRRVNLLKQEGITFVTNTEIGKDISAEELKESFDAVLLCAGSQKHRDILIEGRESKGIYFAMDYLTKSIKGLLDGTEVISAEGKDVIVIGGGDTGADCVATALRQGAKSVVQFGKHEKMPDSRLERNPWPEYPNTFKLDYAYEEAAAIFGEDPREYLIQTKKFVADENGHVKELHTVQMEKTYHEDGTYTMKEIPGTEKVWPAQLVLIAIGFTGTEPKLLDAFQVEKTSRNTAKAKYGQYTTNVEGVFAAGDMRRGQSLVVWAIHEGREAAREIDRYLMGETFLP
ncbi:MULTISPECIES: glutamate synthase subunit beta [Bacillus]|uniref:glutamate synthase subunit beta n=1 Tax=Bacillus TaxID=1386 RepID=UPI00065DDE36|nr:glutamate synthase subunit beta [Bacillus smithii]AKP46091.1 Glutamate synthase NADPH small chain [Bacillus smithii]MED1488479.1 glutamate synthase subunit beta [Bacillus smithii]MED4884204.1 glutamate synthase subunit beta [Bacillus smithii]MED4927969.1 glutamate synthase subunit beta [Bacillus smithii]